MITEKYRNFDFKNWKNKTEWENFNYYSSINTEFIIFSCVLYGSRFNKWF